MTSTMSAPTRKGLTFVLHYFTLIYSTFPYITLDVRCDYYITLQYISLEIRCDSIRLDSFRGNSIRFDSARLDSIRFDSVRFDSIRFDSIRFDSIRFGSVRFDSVRSPLKIINKQQGFSLELEIRVLWLQIWRGTPPVLQPQQHFFNF